MKLVQDWLKLIRSESTDAELRQALLQAGTILMDLPALSESKSLLTEASKRTVGRASLYDMNLSQRINTKLARVNLRLGDTTAARESIKSVLSYGTANVAPFSELIELCLDKGLDGEVPPLLDAADAAMVAHRDRSSFALAHYDLFLSALRTDSARTTWARTLINRCRNLIATQHLSGADDTLALLTCREACVAFDQKQFAETVSLLQSVLQKINRIDPRESLRAHLLFLEAFIQQGKEQEAKQLFSKEVSQESSNPMNLPEYYLEAAKLFLKAGFRKTAEELLKDRARRFGSYDTACFVALAEFYNLHGRPQEAIDVLEKFGTQHDDNTSSVPDCKIWYDVCRERSRAYRRLQDLGESAKWAQRALAVSKLYPSIAGSYTSRDR